MKNTAIPWNTCVSSRHNNLNIIRFIAALAVIFSHSFSVTEGAQSAGTLLDIVTDGRLSPGGVAVAVFFVYSGILIAKSVTTHTQLSSFFKKRVLRIFPELIVCVLGSIALVGACTTTLNAWSYFTNPATWRYMLNICMIPTHALPGTFEQNPYPSVVNASLWTIPAQFMCYVACFVLFKLTRFNKRTCGVLCVLAVAITCAYLAFAHNVMLSFVRALLEFFIGVMFYVFRDYITLKPQLALAACVAFAALVACGQDVIAMLVCFPYMIVWLGWGAPFVFDRFCARQDYSYGIFLWGFPMQQLIAHLWPGVAWWQNMLLGWICAGICAYIGVAIIAQVKKLGVACVTNKNQNDTQK